MAVDLENRLNGAPAASAGRRAGVYLNSISSLPVSPTLINELLGLFKDPDREVDQVVKLISFEPSLTAELLKRSNTVYFASSEPVTDVFEAVTRLGFYEVCCIVVTMFGSGTKTLARSGAGLDVEALWQHSAACAVGASVIAETIGESKPVAFTAGLLHDVGKLVLASVERETYAKMVSTHVGREGLLIVGERDAFGTDHAELGGELMSRWNLPEEVAAAVRCHHNFTDAKPHLRLAAVVQSANAVAHQLRCADSAESLIGPPSLRFLGLRQDDFSILITAAGKELERVKDLFGI